MPTPARPKHRLLAKRKEVVERYFRFKIARTGREVGRSIGRMRARRSLLRSEKIRQKALAKTLKIFATEAARAKRLGLASSWKVLNLGLFFLIAERDIQSVKVDALTHPDSWRRSLAARVMLLTIHELDFDKVAGREFNDIVAKRRLPADLAISVRDAMRGIRKAQAKVKVQFAHLRHSTIAHRDADALAQYRDIVQLDELEVAQAAVEFYAAVASFSDMLPRLMSYLGSMQNVLTQMIEIVQYRVRFTFARGVSGPDPFLMTSSDVRWR